MISRECLASVSETSICHRALICFLAAFQSQSPFSPSRPSLWCLISSLLCRYDLDCKSDNLSKHVSASFTSAAQQSVVHSWKYYTAKCLPSLYNSCLIWIGMSAVKVAELEQSSRVDIYILRKNRWWIFVTRIIDIKTFSSLIQFWDVVKVENIKSERI